MGVHELDLDRNPLRSPGTGGPGFCYPADRDLFRGSGSVIDGPLLVALDSNIILDLEEHGTSILEVEPGSGAGGRRDEELDALGQILEVWLVRDIRFIVVPSTRTDYRKQPPPRRLAEREHLFEQIELALTFQLDDWSEEAARFAATRASTSRLEAVLSGLGPLDARMVRAAWDAGVDVFLTRDQAIIKATSGTPAPVPSVLSPIGLWSRLAAMGEDPFFSGRVDHPGCRWSSGMPFGDTGKWAALFGALDV